jgi:adenosylcobinamide-phosphate synthase
MAGRARPLHARARRRLRGRAALAIMLRFALHARPRRPLRGRAALAIVLGFAADRAVGDPARWHPVAGFGRVAAWVERRVWRPSRLAGALYAVALVGAVAALTVAAGCRLASRGRTTLATSGRGLPPRGRTTLATSVLWTTLGGRSLERAALDLREALAADELDRARALAPALAGRDPSTLGEAELARAAVESVAENTSDAVVAPLVWMAALGPAGAAGYRAVNTLDAMVGHRGERYERFGWAAARLDDLANWVPARLTALLVLALAAGRRRATWHAAMVDGARHPSPNAGRVEGAFAGALGLRLGGASHYAHGTEIRPQLGDGASPRLDDIGRATRLARHVGLAAAALAALGARG